MTGLSTVTPAAALLPSAEVLRPGTLAQALTMLAEPGAVPVGGGLTLSLARRAGRLSATRLVAVGGLAELTQIAVSQGVLVIGAGIRLASLAVDPVIQAWCPALSAAAGSVATGRIRRMATLGGNILARDALHDPPVALAVVGATAVVTSEHGSRRVAVAELARGSALLQPAEVLTAVELPGRAPGEGNAYRTFLPRGVWEYGAVNVAASVILTPDATVLGARLAVGVVVGTPQLIELTTLTGHPATIDEFRIAAGLATEHCEPIADVRGSSEYKRAMLVHHAVQALSEASREAGHRTGEDTDG